MTSVTLFGHDYNRPVLIPRDLTATNVQELRSHRFGVDFFRDVLDSVMTKGTVSPPNKGEPVETGATDSGTVSLQVAVLKKVELPDRPPNGYSVRLAQVESISLVGYDADPWPANAGNPLWVPASNGTKYALLYLNAAKKMGDRTIPSAEVFVVQLEASQRVEQEERLQDAAQMLVELGKHGKTICVLSAGFLQNIACALNTDCSWEAFATDCRSLFDASSRAKNFVGPARLVEARRALIEALRDCHVVIVRGYAHAAYVRTKGDDKPLSEKLHYVVDARHLSNELLGPVRGFTSILTVSICAEVFRDAADPLARIETGIRRGLLRCSVLDRYGYANRDSGRKPEYDPDWAKKLMQLDFQAATKKGKPEQQRDHEWTSQPTQVSSIEIPRNEPGWCILTTRISTDAADVEHRNASDRSGEYAVEIAHHIVIKGLLSARDEYQFPVARFGDLRVVDRREFEGCWELQSLMGMYCHAEPNDLLPLSLSVFGPPGSGKSFAVRQLAKNAHVLGEGSEPIVANLSQFSSVEDLALVLQRLRDVALRGRIPLILFEEFDTHWDRPFGWLKYFLSPMQDGQFRDRGHTLGIGRAIFVFVGGINHSFSMLDARLRNRDFIEAKGPDFISRLRGHMDVLGVHRSESDDDKAYLIRRAVLLRQFLKMHQPQILDKDRKAGIDEEIVNCFLHVGSFKHGVRSLETLVRMCRIPPFENRLHWGTLPTPDQLQMHVDYMEFQGHRFG